MDPGVAGGQGEVRLRLAGDRELEHAIQAPARGGVGIGGADHQAIAGDWGLQAEALARGRPEASAPAL